MINFVLSIMGTQVLLWGFVWAQNAETRDWNSDKRCFFLNRAVEGVAEEEGRRGCLVVKWRDLRRASGAGGSVHKGKKHEHETKKTLQLKYKKNLDTRKTLELCRYNR